MAPAPAPLETPPPTVSRRRLKLPPSVWESWDDEHLLSTRLCDLDLGIAGSGLEERIGELFRELDTKAVGFRPYFWLSDEWFCPDGVPGIAIPFYLAHPRLARLEHAQMLEVEGGTREWCLKILRHETGHAIENAHNLRRRRRRQQVFGKTTEPYPDHYAPRPYSRSFVVNLDAWYGQSHPDEDFAETFAVWLEPGSDWAARYAGWPALRKLEYVDELMREIATRPPLVRTHETPHALPTLRRTLRVHYRRRRRHYRVGEQDLYDRDLLRLFSAAPEHATRPAAARFLSRIRGEVRRRVQRWTGQYQYLIDQVLEEMIERCRVRGLHLAGSEDEARLEMTTLVTARTMSLLLTGRHRVPL